MNWWFGLWETTNQCFGRRKLVFEKRWCLLSLRIYLPEIEDLTLLLNGKMVSRKLIIIRVEMMLHNTSWAVVLYLKGIEVECFVVLWVSHLTERSSLCCNWSPCGESVPTLRKWRPQYLFVFLFAVSYRSFCVVIFCDFSRALFFTFDLGLASLEIET